jgi:aerobic C4-dicarboxylate transport protein
MSSAAVATPYPAKSPIYHSLFLQVVIASILGALIGVYAPDFAKGLKILSAAFLKLITMIVAPIVFCVVVHGVASAGDLKKVGRLGLIALIYFEALTTVALTLGILLGYVFAPGHGLNRDPASLDPNALATYAENAPKLQGGGFGGFLLNVIPATAFDAFARNDVL